MPIRYIGHWNSILTEIRRAGFQPHLIRYNRHTPQDFTSSLSVAALAE